MEPDNPALSNWRAFVQEFGSRFGVPNTAKDAEGNSENENAETGRNLRHSQFGSKPKHTKQVGITQRSSGLSARLPDRITDILRIAPTHQIMKDSKISLHKSIANTGKTKWLRKGTHSAANGTPPLKKLTNETRPRISTKREPKCKAQCR
ncbi:hypothetical protein Hypma_001643 [Hypsizygus marmoreus]|uniref:Uncharacterized protein n=1 Tax=Hypsizygus marmoreus TaxID=39966 RepID=A0A369J5V9_HYPMA|nr:hypothetical protein Hypma_001643 [Hypsizygus marmoreus]